MLNRASVIGKCRSVPSVCITQFGFPASSLEGDLRWLEGQAETRLRKVGRSKRGTPPPKVPNVQCGQWAPRKSILQDMCRPLYVSGAWRAHIY